MSEFSTALVIKLPSPWPPLAPVPLSHDDDPLLQHALIAHPDSHLELILSPSDPAARASQDFQTIDATAGQWVMVGLVVRGKDAEVWIGDVRLLPMSEMSSPLVVPRRPATQSRISFEHPDAAAICAKWIEWRKNRFARSRVRTNRRLKSIDEQAVDLRDSLKMLRVMLDEVAAGKPAFLGPLANQLRSLVYWGPGQYNPLLLRMASKANLPLPLYAMADHEPPPVLPKLHFRPAQPEFEQQFPAQTLMDVQEWLTIPALIEYDSALPGGSRSTPTKELIAEAAHTLSGGSHTDEDKSDFLAMLESLGTDATALQLFFCRVARIISGMGEWVLGELERRGDLET